MPQEALRGGKALEPKHGAEGRRRDVASKRSRFFVKVLGGHTEAFIGRADEPAIEQNEVQLLQQLALAVDGVKHLQQQGEEQLFRGTGATGQPGSARPRPASSGADVGRNPLLQADIA